MFGPSGVGKSYWIGQYLLSFRKKFKDRPIYIFSPIKDDKAFMKAKPIYIKIDESILKDPLQTVEFQSGLCVFDDIESLSKQYHSVISEFRDKCLEVGRHDGIDIISVHHVIEGGNSTKKLLMNLIIWFVFQEAILQLLRRYAEIITDSIKKILII